VAKSLEEFGWGDEIIDENAVTSVSALAAYEDKKSNYHFFKATIGGSERTFYAENVNQGWFFGKGDPDPQLNDLRQYLISCIK
jgi:hypothetical protein